MNFLEEVILKEGQALSEKVLKVDSFLNHQIDPEVMRKVGKNWPGDLKMLESPKSLPLNRRVLLQLSWQDWNLG